jgi:DNA-directed RNA polymerase specialized sigma24 family protein
MAPDNASIGAVVNRQRGLDAPMAFEASTISNRLEVLDLSKLLQRVLQELPEVQKEAIHLAAKGMSRREIAAKNKISVGTDEPGLIWLNETSGGN